MFGSSVSPTTAAIMYVVIALLLAYRIYMWSKPGKISVTRMFVVPSIFLALTALAVWGTVMTASLAWWVIALFVLGGFAIGVPFGIVRGHHTTVRATEKPGVMYLEASWVVPVLFVLAFGGRFAVRLLLPRGEFAGVIGDGLIAFVVGMMAVSYYVIYRKYVGLEHEAGQI
jgi:hypothetical protein